MAETPSPYAPGIISNEPARTRPAGRALVFLAAAFMMVLAGATTDWHFWMKELATKTGVSPTSPLVVVTISVPGVLVLLWAYLSDRVPLFGARREGYLLVAGLVGAAAWGALGFGAAHATVWVTAPVLIAAAMAVSRAAIDGGLTEIGRRHATTGVMAASYVMVSDLADLGGVAQDVLSERAFGWTAGVGAVLWLTIVLLVATLGFADDDAAPTVPASELPAGIPRFLRSRTFWAAVAVAVCAGFASLPRPIIDAYFHVRGRETTMSLWVWGHVIPVAAAGIYLLACRRLRFAALLRLALALKALALVAFWLLLGAGPNDTIVALIAPTAGDALANVALIDLAMRAAPRGREAFGFVLLSGLPHLITGTLGSVTGMMMDMIHVPVSTVALFCAGAAVVGVAAVSLLPRAVSSASGDDGR